MINVGICFKLPNKDNRSLFLFPSLSTENSMFA